MKSVRSILSTILCIFLLTGCGEKMEPSRQTVPVETAAATVAPEPMEIPLLDYTKLPQGYELQELESGNILILENGKKELLLLQLFLLLLLPLPFLQQP